MSPVTGRNRTVNAPRFSMVPRADVPRSVFDRAHIHKTSFSAGALIPIYVDEVLPGDSHAVEMSAFCRLATAQVPIMDTLYLDSHFFFVPNRLVWSNWERFMGEQLTITDTTQFLTPYVEFTTTGGTLAPGTLPDYMGITVNNTVGGALRVSALPFRAYQLIWNDWFRDQDLQNPVPTLVFGDGPDLESWFLTLPRNKKHDYFTSARPWPQKPAAVGGFEGSVLAPGQGFVMRAPYQGAAPVTGIGVPTGSTTTAGPAGMITPGSRTLNFQPYFGNTVVRLAAGGTDAEPDVKVLVNDIRTAVMIQGMLERNARGGSRYAEIIRSHFGVVSPDARLQRPEYLGGGRSVVSVNPVTQTTPTGIAGTSTILGEQAGVGTAVASRHGFRQSFTEHGFVIGMISVRSELTYQSGVDRMWFRRSLYDFYWPGLAHLGEQAILNREVYAVGAAADTAVWGYQERWSEYKYKPSRTSGWMRSSSSTPLDMWHLGQAFTVLPVLGNTFVQDIPPIARVATTAIFEGTHFLIDALFNARLVRAMPMFSIPGVGSHL